MDKEMLSPNYWNKAYQERNTAWDLGYPSPALQEYFNSLTDKNLRILIPGAGNSYEGEYLLQQGFTNITILDYAPEAIENFKQRVKDHTRAKLLCEDFFLHSGQYDLIVEQTFFCALHPLLREKYANKMHELLFTGGRLAGLLFTTVPDGDGPPFGGSAEEYLRLFSSLFHIEKMKPCKNSIKPRAGRELFFIISKKQ